MLNRKIKLIITILSTLLLVSLTACRGETGNQVQTIKVKRGDISIEVSADGNLSLVQDRKLVFGTGGTIAQVKVKEGDRVTKGQLLAKLDTADLDRAVKTAESAVNSAEVDLKQAENNVKSAEADAKQATDNISNANIDLETAENAYNKLIVSNPYVTYKFRLADSIDAIRVGEQRLKEVQDELQKIARGQPYSLADIENLLKQAQDSFAIAETQLAWGFDAGTRPANADYWTLRNLQLQIDKAKLALNNANTRALKAAIAVDNARNLASKARIAVDNARNNLATAKSALDKATITSPIDGVVAQVNIKEGDTWAAVTSLAAIEVIDPRQLELSVRVDEIDIATVAVGQKAVISLDALPDQKFDGTVSFISSLPTVETGVVSYKVRIALSAPENTPLKSGMSVTADIIQVQRKNVLLVPNTVIRQDSQGKPFVQVLENGQAQNRAVVVGITNGFQTEIINGLTEADLVVEPSSRGNSNSLFGGLG